MERKEQANTQDSGNKQNNPHPSPFNEASDQRASQEPTPEEEAEAEQQRKEALTERD